MPTQVTGRKLPPLMGKKTKKQTKRENIPYMGELDTVHGLPSPELPWRPVARCVRGPHIRGLQWARLKEMHSAGFEPWPDYPLGPQA